MPAVDVVVIGGGIVGTAIAAFLAEAGLRVRLHEQETIAAGASGRNSGIVQHPFDPVMAGLYRGTLAEYRRLADDSAASFRLDDEPAGLLYVGRDRAAAERTAATWAEAWPASAPEMLDGVALTRLEPALAPDLVACRLAIGFPVAPAAATEAFASQARRLGVEIIVGGGPARPAIGGDRVRGIEWGGRIEPAGVVVVAAGPWTPDVIDPGGSWRPIRSSWGVVASVVVANAPRHGLEAIDIDIEPSEGDGRAPDHAGPDEAIEFSLVPAAGSSALGSTFLPDEPDPDAWLDALRRVGSRYVPGVADAPLLGLRRCARPVSRDGR
ncbi:MAG TPA: FAD-dependent oxidoreductase, partial [Candidatus Limnocylindrales bacterium]|nr:FAD-dependent oxidoreductase [Candidatus Limnocylindrales bacterium]